MRILAFDTSGPVASIAVADGENTLAECNGPDRSKHGESLLLSVDETLRRTGLSLAQIELLAVGIGPGSFTGVRVGLATAKGLALATGKPLVGVVSLRALARGAAGRRRGLVAAIIDAYRGEVYCALYELEENGRLEEKLAPINQPPEAAAERLRAAAANRPMLLCGNGVAKYASCFANLAGETTPAADASRETPSAAALAQEAALTFEKNGPSDLVLLEPLYLRPSDALPQQAPK